MGGFSVVSASLDTSASRPTRDERRRIVVLGYIVRGPIGGLAWHHLNYVLGLAQLGHEVLFVEDSDDYASCYDPSRHVMDTDPTYGLRFATDVFHRAGLDDRWCYHDAHRGAWHGPMASRAVAFCRTADLLLNVSGVNPLRDWSAGVPVRALIDTDPVFTQVRHLNEPDRLALAQQHNRFLTFGENIPAGTSRVPDDGLPWRPTRQPIVLDCWPIAPPCPDGPITTVMQWDSYKQQQYADVTYGMKSQSFDAYIDLPGRTDARMTLALGGDTAPRQRLTDHGWALDDPLTVTRDPWTYQDYIRSAMAEWSVAKHGYVEGHSGWFSERSACFLATGRPVILQDTGFSAMLPTGEGLLAFRSLDEAIDAITKLCADYPLHCRAARQIAEDHFASGSVLQRLLAEIDAASTEDAIAPCRAGEDH